MNTSLTSPKDRTSNRPDLQPNAPALTEDELKRAKDALLIKRDFPSIERRFVDPEIPTQKIGLVSFVPASGATPDGDGFYGFLKLRGNYLTVEDADNRGEFLIRNADSYHDILYTKVGVPFPLMNSKDLGKHVEDEMIIDISKKVEKEVALKVKEKRAEEKQTMKTIQDREKELLKQNTELLKNDSIPETEDPDEAYTLMRSKRAQLVFTYLHQMERLHKEVIPALIKTSRDVAELDAKRPELKEECFRRFTKAREEVGIPKDDIQSGFVKYIIDDVSEDDFNRAFFGEKQSYKQLQEAIVRKQ